MLKFVTTTILSVCITLNGFTSYYTSTIWAKIFLRSHQLKMPSREVKNRRKSEVEAKVVTICSFSTIFVR